MALTLPSNPTVGQTFSANNRTWSWTGTTWQLTGATNVVTASTVAGFPSTGSANVLYVALDTARTYQWQGAYLEVGAAGGNVAGSVTIPGLGDSSYSSVSLLLHGDGNTTDSGPLGFTGTATNVATNGTAKFGTSSLVFSGTSVLSYANNAAFNFPGDFTVEAWIYLTTAIGSGAYTEYALAAQWSGTGGLAWLWYLKSNGFTVVLGNGSAVVGYDNLGSVSLTTNQWHHVALSRSGSTISSYINGARFGTYSSSLNLSATGPLTIGDQDASTTRPFYGRIDEFRITKGVARYTGDTYAVPTAAFSNSTSLTVPVVYS